MKILHLFDHSIPLHSGYTFRSKAILLQQQAFGWSTCHLTGPKQGPSQTNEEVIDGLQFYRTKQPTGFFAKLPLINQLALIPAMKQRLLEVIAKEKPDVIHAHSPALNGMAAVLAGKAAGIPVVYEIRAFWEDAAVDHGTCKEGDLRYRLTRALETYVIKRADAVTTICEGLRSDILQRGVPASKVTVIPNAVNVEQFSLIEAKDAKLSAALGLVDKKVLGFLGSFYAYEGLDLLVAALPQLLAIDPDYRLLLVGGGPQADALKAQIKALQLEHAVVMPGRVPHQQISSYYSLVDLLVYPRKGMRLTELVTPLKPLEAMAQGKLVLASAVGGHRELITHNETGWLFRQDDSTDLCQQIQHIFAHREQHAAIKANGRHYVSQIRNWQQSVACYQDVYPALVRS